MMGLTWFCLGVLTFVSALFLIKLSKSYRLNWISWGGLITGIFTVLFSIAWAMGSVLEGEPRAASMGLLMFGLGGIGMLTVTGRYVRATAERITEPEADRIPPKPSKARPVSTIAKETGPFAKGIRYAAYLSLFTAFILGMMTGEKDYEAMLIKKFGQKQLTKVNDDPVVFQLGKKIDGFGNYVLIQEGQGYGGQFIVAVRIMDDARVHEVIFLDDKETPAFIQKTRDAHFIDQFIGKKVSDDFIVGEDIDAVSGATISSMAGTEAIRKGSHLAATHYFKLPPDWKKVPWKFGINEVLLLGIFILAFIPNIYRDKPWKYIYMVAAIAIVGFYLNAAVSIGSFSGLAMGNIPGIKDHIIWWTLTMGTVLGIALLGKNVYCYRICPFYGVQFLLNKISGSRLTLSPELLKRGRFMANFLLWLALLTIFLSSHPALGAYEPFAMMFSLEGIGVQWYILPVSLIGAFFIATYWCRFFCPVGNSLTQVLKWRKAIIDKVKTNYRRGEK